MPVEIVIRLRRCYRRGFLRLFLDFDFSRFFSDRFYLRHDFRLHFLLCDCYFCFRRHDLRLYFLLCDCYFCFSDYNRLYFFLHNCYLCFLFLLHGFCLCLLFLLLLFNALQLFVY
ncbi:MAG: hypothetical protein LBK12_07235 [Odoribacteraceae bacterium]|nr:hypothetical protein [Odoribacteraceae bacterium]